jgi:lysozyme
MCENGNVMAGVKTKAVAGSAIALAIGVIGIFEGYRPEPYADPAGLPTVCYGHTGEEVKLDGVLRTEEQCNDILKMDLDRSWNAIDHFVKVPLEPWTRAALASFIFNVGTGAFSRSTLLTLLNDGHTEKACDELLKWNKVHKQTVSGLARRREAEWRLCRGKK